MDGRQSFPKKAFPPPKEKPKNADSEGDRDLVCVDSGGDPVARGAAEEGEGEEERRARTFSPPKGRGGGNYASYPPGGGGGGRRAGGGSGPQPPCCLVERCTADLAEARRYYRRHKVCEAHSKAPVVIVAGLRQRFCQQCSRFHELSEFDEMKRSCRRRLVGHNERRRKSSGESQGEGIEPLPAGRLVFLPRSFPHLVTGRLPLQHALSLLSSSAGLCSGCCMFVFLWVFEYE